LSAISDGLPDGLGETAPSPYTGKTSAGVAKLVDATDLKSYARPSQSYKISKNNNALRPIGQDA
jgi:hypothetical protein